MNDRYSFLVCMDKRLARKLMVFGTLLCAIGVLGIVAPKFISIAMSLILALMLILTGVVLSLFTYVTHQKDRTAWVKALTPLVLGIFLAIKPFALVIVLGLAIFFYFILNGVTTITIALELKPQRGWLPLFISGVVSLSLAGIFILFWPYSTHWYLGWMIGISLLLDGLALIMLAKKAENCQEFPLP